MAKNKYIEAVFLTADDAMQGLWGLHTYLITAASIVPPEALIPKLPSPTFRITHHWERQYDRQEFVDAFSAMGIEFLLSRSSVVSLAAIFEATLNRVSERLAELGHNPKLKNKGYKALLQWAFILVAEPWESDRDIRDRLPVTCGDLDNARRIRNCIAHNNGRYDDSYLTDLVQTKWVASQFENGAESPTSNAISSEEKIFLDTKRFEYFARSHIEFLHVLYNTIQHKFFGHHVPFNYAAAGKRIEWHRLLSGKHSVRM